MTVGETLRALREEAGLKQVDLAKRAGLSQSKISRLESGEIKLKVTDARALVRVFGPSAAKMLLVEEQKGNASLMGGVLAVIPSAGRAAADASGGMLFDLNQKGEDLVLPDSLRAVKVVSDSMAPVIRRNQHVLIDLEAVPADGDLVVVETRDGRRLFKRFFAHNKTVVELQTANPVHPEPAILLKRTQIRRIIVVAGACYR